jgi:hypothetical protein
MARATPLSVLICSLYNILSDAFLHNNIDLEALKTAIPSILKLIERVTYTFINMSHNGNILQKFQEEQIKMKKKLDTSAD